MRFYIKSKQGKMCQRYTFRTQPTGLGHYNFRETAGGEIAVFPYD